MRRRRVLYGLAGGAAAVGLSACGQTLFTSESAPATAVDLPVLGKAPEVNLSVWVNSEPISLASLKGTSAVGIAFWTYG